MFQLTVDENLWLAFNIERLFYVDVNLINLAILSVAVVVFLRGRKLYKIRKSENNLKETANA